MVLVFGSINLDLVSRVERFPGPGETLLGTGFAAYPGGKGANQALAAARAGADVRLYAAVGRDVFADRALELLAAGNVNLAGVAQRVAQRFWSMPKVRIALSSRQAQMSTPTKQPSRIAC
jgi:ribokinase